MQEYLIGLLGEPLVAYVIMAAVPLVFVLVYVLITLYMEMKVAAHIQDRVAYMRTGWHGVLQPFADIFKLLQKEDIIPAQADRLMFTLAPFFVFVGTYAGFAAIPFSQGFIAADLDLGVLYIVAVGSIVVAGLLMSGWASNNKWSLLGSVRSAAQIVSYEIPTALSILVAVMITGSLSLSEVSRFQEGGLFNWVIFGGPGPLLQKLLLMPFTVVSFCVLWISGIAESNRTPFDLPEAESELVQGYNTEYSGMKWAMFYLAEYGNMFLVSAIVSCLYLGGWQSPFGDFMSGPYWGAFWLVAKGMFFVFIQVWLRWTLPRLRVDQLMYVSWKVMVPFMFVCIFAVGLILVW